MGIFSNIKVTRRCEELEDCFRKLQRDFTSLQLEWQNTLDKLLSMKQRIEKRAQAAERADSAAAPSAEVIDVPGDGFPLSPHQLTVQQRILARRRRTNGGLQ